MKVHKHNNERATPYYLPPIYRWSQCGHITTIGEHLTDDWSKVTCGNCRAGQTEGTNRNHGR
jgi:predicted nucleic acid-binding Zn ribbon protein